MINYFISITEDGVSKDVPVSKAFFQWCGSFEDFMNAFDGDEHKVPMPPTLKNGRQFTEKAIRYLDLIIRCATKADDEETVEILSNFPVPFEQLQTEGQEFLQELVVETEEEEWPHYVIAHMFYTGEAVGDFAVDIYEIASFLSMDKFLNLIRARYIAMANGRFDRRCVPERTERPPQGLTITPRQLDVLFPVMCTQAYCDTVEYDLYVVMYNKMKRDKVSKLSDLGIDTTRWRTEVFPDWSEQYKWFAANPETTAYENIVELRKPILKEKFGIEAEEGMSHFHRPKPSTEKLSFVYY